MIISRAPYRISFFGGGTDYPAWYLRHGGQTLSTTINKYCYLTVRYLPPFFQHRLRVVYSKIELCQHFSEIEHPAVRETLRFLEFDRSLEIHHDGDLPARSGIGSSSSFTVGLLQALYALKGVMVSRKQLARESIYIEQELIKETVGSQDQTAAAYGGLNRIVYKTSGEVVVEPAIIPTERRRLLQDHLMLFYTGIIRTAADVAKSYVNELESKDKLLREMGNMVDRGLSILGGDGPIEDFGELMHEAWQKKQRLGSKITNPIVDEIYQRAKDNGALGGKISGAGGGGFMLLFVLPKDQPRVRNALKDLICVPIEIEDEGSKIILYEPEGQDYSKEERALSRQRCNLFRELEGL